MASQTPDRFGPTLSLHVVGADHDFIQVLDAVIDVIEAKFPIHPRKRQIGIEKIDIVMIDRAVRPPENPECLLNVGQAEAEAIPVKSPRFLEVRRLEHDVQDGFGSGFDLPFTLLIEAIRSAGRIDGIRCRSDRCFCEYLEGDRLPFIRQAMGRPIRVDPNGPIAL